MAEVTRLTVVPSDVSEVEEVLRTARSEAYSDIVIVGYANDRLVMVSSSMTNPELAYLLQQAVREVLARD